MGIVPKIIAVKNWISHRTVTIRNISLALRDNLISLLIRPIFFQWHRRYPVAIGAGGLTVILCILLVLAIPGKSRKARAGDRGVIEIELPAGTVVYTNFSIPTIPALPEIGAFATRDLPKAEIEPEEESLPMVTISSHDGIPLTAELGLYKRPGVMFTDELVDFARGLSNYFSSHHFQAMITSGVRTSDGQLEIIKERIAAYGMTGKFPGLANATVADKEMWTPAWEWLKERHVPVNPPADYVNDDGNVVGASLHLKGLAMDVVANNLDALKEAIIDYANTGYSAGTLHISGLTRERDCVHIALTK